MTVFLAISNQIVRIGIKSILIEYKNSLQFVESTTSFELLHALSTHQPDLLFIDLIDNGNFDWDDIQKIKESYPTLKTVFLAKNYTKEQLHQLKEIEAQGLLYVDGDDSDIIRAFDAAVEDKKYYASKILDVLLSVEDVVATPNNQSTILTDREIEVVKCIALGFTNKEIGKQLFLSHHTVSVHRKNIYYKLDVHSAKELLSFALQYQLISPEEL